MDKFPKIVEDQVSSTEIDEKKLSEHLNKVSIWIYAVIYTENFQQASKDEKTELLKRYYNAAVAQFDGNFVIFLISDF